jgi:hypothetical protein
MNVMLKRLCNDLDIGQLRSPRNDVASRMKDKTTESRDFRIESEEDVFTIAAMPMRPYRTSKTSPPTVSRLAKKVSFFECLQAN